jgi:hypothetical protein
VILLAIALTLEISLSPVGLSLPQSLSSLQSIELLDNIFDFSSFHWEASAPLSGFKLILCAKGNCWSPTSSHLPIFLGIMGLVLINLAMMSRAFAVLSSEEISDDENVVDTIVGCLGIVTLILLLVRLDTIVGRFEFAHPNLAYWATFILVILAFLGIPGAIVGVRGGYFATTLRAKFQVKNRTRKRA